MNDRPSPFPLPPFLASPPFLTFLSFHSIHHRHHVIPSLNDQSIISSAGFDVRMFGSGEVAKILRAATSLKGDM